MDILIRSAKAADIPRMCSLLSELFSIEADFSPDLQKQSTGLSLLLNDKSDLSIVLHVRIYSGNRHREHYLALSPKAALSDLRPGNH